MGNTHTRLVSFAAALFLLTPVVVPAQPPGGSEGIVVIDFATGNTGRPHGLTASNIKLRSGTTSTVRVIKHVIDLVPDPLIRFDGATIIGPIVKGRTTGGIGFIEVNVTPDGVPGLGALLHVGTSDHFSFLIVHRGLITSVGFSPNPTTIQGGTPFTLTVHGEDLGNPRFTQLSCHDITGTSGHSSFTTTLTVTATLTRTANCTGLGPFTFQIGGFDIDDPPSYSKGDGTKIFTFGPYRAPCTSAPDIGGAVITTPLANEVIEIPQRLPSHSVTMRWRRNTATGVPAPNNEWLVDLTGRRPTVVTDTARTFSVQVPGTYTATVRARNCGQLAPASSVTFSVRIS